MSKWLAISLMLAAILSVQVGASIAKSLFPLLGPEGVCLLRIIVATVLLLSIWKPWRSKPNAQALKVIAVYGIALGVMNLTYYLALQRLPLGLTVALEFTGPLAVALFYSRRALDFVWAALATTGIVLPLLQGDHAVDPLGVVLALTAGGAWACYILFGKRASGVAPSGVATSVGMAVALLTVSPIAAPKLNFALLMEPKIAAAAIGVGLLSSALPYSLEMIALRHLPAKNFGILLSLSPAVAALAGLVVLNEALTLVQSLALGCILIASIGSAVFMREDPPPPIEV
jgi:inner membrane transporter RhtA